MHLSTVGRHALNVMVELVSHPDREPIPCYPIAASRDIADQHLALLLSRLERAGLVQRACGPDGGYTLTRDASAISVKEIVCAVEGMADLGGSVSDVCPTDCAPDRLSQAIHEIPDAVTLAGLCERRRDGVREPADSHGHPAEGRATEYHDFPASLLLAPEAASALQQSVADALAEPIMVIDADYRVRWMNRSAREFSSAGAGALPDVRCYQVSHRRDVPCDGETHPCPLRQVRESGQPLTVVHEHYQADGVRRYVELIASPLWGADGACVGVIECSRDITARVRAEEALQQYTERLRALAERLTEVSEAERQRLARELHDQVGQNLTVLGINLNIVRTQMPEDVVPAVRSRLEDSLLLVEQTTRQIRDVMAELRPPVLDDYGLLAALHWHAEQFARRTGIAVSVEHEQPVPRLDERIESALFRIAQEALNNVAKHAQATAVTVTVHVNRASVRLIVSDDGIGFDAKRLAEPSGGRGWGLLSMTERAEAVCGHCLIESQPGLGTQVIVQVPR